ncbi:MAG: SGNH/GDSL hydrolase family protein [Candidatus Sumerlaeaceae bacterium]
MSLLFSSVSGAKEFEAAVGATENASALRSFKFGKFKPRAGDRIAFFGDSLTRANVYPTIIEHHYRLHQPELGLTFAQFGVDSNSSVDGAARIDSDLVPFNPTVVVVFFGINDALYRSPWELPETQQRYASFQVNYPHLLDLLNQKLPAARLVLCTTTVIDPVLLPEALGFDQAGFNDVLSHYSGFIHEVGKARGLPVVDLYNPMLKALRAGRAQSPPLLVIVDGVHPGIGGYTYLAAAFLEQWGAGRIRTLK